MTALALIFAGIAGLLHVLFFKLESLDWRKPKTWRTFGLASQADADTTASLAFNQGFYNLFLAIGAATGIVVVASSDTHDSVGWTLIIFACGSMLGAALVLISSGGKPFARAAAIQGVPALVAVVASIVAAN
jgi:putative membrane protein